MQNTSEGFVSQLTAEANLKGCWEPSPVVSEGDTRTLRHHPQLLSKVVFSHRKGLITKNYKKTIYVNEITMSFNQEIYLGPLKLPYLIHGAKHNNESDLMIIFTNNIRVIPQYAK